MIYYTNHSQTSENTIHVTQLFLNLLDKWLKGIDKGELVGATFFDLRKSFDIVDHKLLLKKLSIYKFSSKSLSWIKSYLTDRKQCVFDNKLRSFFQSVKAGVPRGSVLGPVFFLLFVNDLPLFINETYLEMYADDTTVHYACKNKNTVKLKLKNGSNGFLNCMLPLQQHAYSFTKDFHHVNWNLAKFATLGFTWYLLGR